ncbi:hypothetical protein [Maricaulis sp.]|uniref:hypothetical protein n=1 Tax=Maricaulis sp. TaxID=1486257 RepID=UPI003A901D75
MSFTTAQDFIDAWAELDAAYVTFPSLASTGGNYQDATPVSTAGEFIDVLSHFPDYFATLQSGATTMGQLALAVNKLFIELGNAYVEYLEAGNPPIMDIAKDRGGAPAPGQTFHDNILGNLGDGPIAWRFGSDDPANNVDVTGDGIGDLIAEPRSVDAQGYGDRPLPAGSNTSNIKESIEWDLANIPGISPEDLDLGRLSAFDGEINLVSGGTITTYATLQEAINASSDGDTITLGAGTYVQTGTVNINKEVSIIGAGDGSTIIETASGSYGIHVTADNVSMSDMAIDASATTTSYGVKIDPGSGVYDDAIVNFSMENMTVSGAGRSEIDMNGLDGGTFTNVTADGLDTSGVGIAVTDSTGITLTDITTTGNNWGAVGLYSAGRSYEPGTDDVTFEGTFTSDDAPGIYMEEELLGGLPTTVTNIDMSGIYETAYIVFNADHRATGENFHFMFGNEADAEAFALALTNPESSVIYSDTTPANVDSSAVGGTFYVYEGMSIQAAVDAADAGATIIVGPGTYDEDIVIDKEITLLSSDGAATTIINGQNGALGAIEVDPSAGAVQIGATGQGFTIQGNNGNGAVENAAIYLQGAQDGITIQGNIIEARGDAGLLSEYSAAVTNLLIDNNEFTGQTFEGAQPSDNGFGTQFDVGNNVPRQLVTIGGNGQNASNVTFTNNTVSGTAGGTNAGGEQGNTLVTIDAANSVIEDNLFTGFTARYATALRAREDNTNIRNNVFDGETAGSPNTGAIYVDTPLPGTIEGNTYITDTGERTIESIAGGQIIRGGTQSDMIDYSASDAGIDVRLWRGGENSGGHAQGDIIRDVESLTGSGFDDVMQGKDGINSTLDGGDGDDYVEGFDGNDTIIGGAGADMLKGRAGEDSLSGGDGDDTLRGGDDNDILVGGAGADLLRGDAGFDTADYSGSAAGIDVRLWRGGANSGGDAEGDKLRDIEHLIGSDFDDVMQGANGVDVTLDAGAGDDYAEGFNGNDTINGGDGNDILKGRAGDDILSGGDGDDILRGGNDNDTLIGGAGADVLRGDAGIDTVDYSDSSAGIDVRLWRNSANTGGDAEGDKLRDIEIVVGSDHDDFLQGKNGVDVTLNGGDGNDFIDGLSGNNTLIGGAGDDAIYGRAGTDRIDGGAGTDTLSGGTDADTFIFSDGYGADTILDFEDGTDTIDLSGVSGMTNAAAVFNAASYDGANTVIDLGGGDTLTINGWNYAAEMDGSEFIFAPAASDLKLATIVSPELTFDVTSGIGTGFVLDLHNAPSEQTGWDAGLFDFDRIDYDAF